MELAQTEATSSSSDSQVRPSSPSAHYSHGTFQPARLGLRATFSFLLHNIFHQASLRLLPFRQNFFQRKLPNRRILFEHRSPGELEGHTHFNGGGGKAKSDEV